MVKLFLLRFLEAFFRHRWLYLLPIVIVIAAGAVYFITLQPTYTASGILYVNNPSLLTSLTAVQNNDTNWWISPAQATTNEIGELLLTDAFSRVVIQDTDLEQYMDDGPGPVEELIFSVRQGVSVFPGGNNQLYITATADNPEIAYQLVPAVVNNYLNWKINLARQDSSVAQGFFSDLIETYAAELESSKTALSDYHDEHPAPLTVTERMEVTHLQNKIDMASNRHNNALEREADAKLAMAQVESDTRQTYVMIDAPQVPNEPDLSKRILAVQSAAFISVGIALSIAAILGATVLDRSFRFPIDVETHLQLPVLAETPDVSHRKKWYQQIMARFTRRKKSEPEGDVKTPITILEDTQSSQPADDMDQAYGSKDVGLST